ncbi:hypothetical protein KW465_03295 [Vibrio fluvialis]|nr:hypothetical protein [Vibrio fluvialis]
MYVPSSFIYEIIQSEQNAVLCESNSKGDLAILAKLPTSIIKAIMAGAPVTFYVHLTLESPSYIALVLKVQDNANNPFFAILPQRWIKDSNKLSSSFFDKDIEFTIFDETDAPVVSSRIKIKTNFKNNRLLKILSSDILKPAIDFNSSMDFMDAICSVISNNSPKRNKTSIKEFKFATQISTINNLRAHHINPLATATYDLSIGEDGTRQELQVYQALSLLSDSKTYHSPYVTTGKKDRELTDILCLPSTGESIIVESKALTVDDSVIGTEYEKYVSKMIKRCEKGIGQIEGTYKAIKRKDRIFVRDTNEDIDINHDGLVSGIVLIDEYRDTNRWSEIYKLVCDSKEKYDININIISVSELIYMIKLYESDMASLLSALDDRFKTSIELKTFNLKSYDYSLPII